MAYGQVDLHVEHVGGGGLYEDLDKMARSGRDDYELIENPFPSDIPDSQQATSTYAGANKTSSASKQQQHSLAEASDEQAYEL